MAENTTSTTTTKASYRAWIRRDTPTIGFFPWGFLGLLFLLGALLFGVTHFADTWIEEEVESAVRTTLDAEGYDDVEIAEVSGQEVQLTGRVSDSRGQDAIELASGALGGTSFGRHVAPTVVTGEFEQAEAEPEVEPEVDEPEVPAEWANIRGQLAGGVLTLRGEVASEEVRDALVADANDRLDPPRLTSVVDELTIAAGPIKAAARPLAERVVMSLSRCAQGSSQAVDGVFSLSCQAPGDDVEALTTDAQLAFDDEGSIGDVTVYGAESVNECEGAFADLLAAESIRFNVGSANVSARSRRLLDNIAEVAVSCPGRIRIEGHTDNQGALEANMELSRQRAASVVAELVSREIDEARLEPVGYGPTRPRAEGDTAAARAQNRRIEFHVIVGASNDGSAEPTESE